MLPYLTKSGMCVGWPPVRTLLSQINRGRMPGARKPAVSGGSLPLRTRLIRTAPRPMLPLTVAMAIQMQSQLQVRSEDHFDYKFEDYGEEHGRMQVHTHSAMVEQGIAPWLSLKGEWVYDGISGATPTGAPPPKGSSQVPTLEIEDIRCAGIFEPGISWGRHTTTPQFAYSLERDYESMGLSLANSTAFNQKNTVLVVGVAHEFDTIMPKFWGGRKEHKDTTDLLIGVTQVLDSRTLLNADITLGTASGYLADPYKGVRFDGYPDPNTLFDERRPGHRTKQAACVALTHYLTPARASAELAYRFYHDSFGIFSHTASLTWFQKIGQSVVISPLFRFYDQTAAGFYHVRLSGDPSDPEAFPGVVTPQFYSADYRLAALYSYTYGLSVTVKVRKWLSLDAAYKRYEMHGHDPLTSVSNFPTANIYTAGLRLWF